MDVDAYGRLAQRHPRFINRRRPERRPAPIRRPTYASLVRPPGWQDELDAALACVDLSCREQHLKEVCRIASEQTMVISLWLGYDLCVMYDNVHTDYLQTHHRQWKPENAWLSK